MYKFDLVRAVNNGSNLDYKYIIQSCVIQFRGSLSTSEFLSNYDANIVTISCKQSTGFEIRHLVLWLRGILLSVILHLIILF